MKLISSNSKWLAGLACGLLVAGAAIGFGEVGRTHTRTDVGDVRGMSKIFRDVAKRTRPAIVTILTTGKAEAVHAMPFDQEDGPFKDLFKNQPEFRQFFRQRQGQQQPMVPHGMGSGFVIDPRGIILTNAHVVNGASEVKVRFSDGREAVASDIHADPRTDIAILHVKTGEAGHLASLPMGNSDEAEVGDWVLAVGSPFGFDQTVTAGIISAKGRDHIGKTDREDFIQTDAAINPGNSGGPLLNLDGEVIGINTAISTRSGGYDGVGFAVPINMAHWVADQLIAKGEVRRAYLGVAIQPVDQTIAAVLNVTPGEGAVVNQVRTSSPAEKAGLKSQDVILDFDGHKVSGPKELQGVVERLEVGKSYPMTVMRDGKRMSVPVTVQEMPKHYSAVAREEAEEDKAEPEPKETLSFDEVGIKVKEITPQVAQELKLKDVKGVLVSSVKPGSVAAEAGLREGMVIERVNKQPVATPDAFQTAMKGVSLKKGLIFEVHTAGGTQLMGIRKN